MGAFSGVVKLNT